MNILFLQRLWPVYGGGETVTICLANEMVRRGWNVGVLYFKHHTREKLPFIDPRIDAQIVEGVDCDEWHQNPKDTPKVLAAAKKYIDEHQTEFIIDQWWDYPYMKGLKGYHGVKIVKCLHQSFYTPQFDVKGIKWFTHNLLYPLYVFYKKRVAIKDVTTYLPWVNKYLFLSTSFQKQYQQMNHDNDERHMLHSINNPSTFTSCIDKSDLDKKENLVLVVARMEEGQKRLTKALKAWRKVEDNPQLSDWRLEMVGEGRSLESYKNLAKKLKLERVSFEGFQEPTQYYRRAKIFLMTSVFEGFGMTLVEAQQNGVVPVVMDTFLSLRDIVEDGVNGCITAYDVDAFANRLIALMGDEEKRNKMALDAIDMSKKFAVEYIVDQWEALFKSL